MTSTAVSDFLISAVLLVLGGVRVRAQLRLAGAKDPRDHHEYIQQNGKRG
jgi:hypothetical protein